MTITAARLDAQAIYQGMDTLDHPAQLTDRHLPQITACDLPAGLYQWVPDARNPYGGAFWLKSWVDKATAECRAQREGA